MQDYQGLLVRLTEQRLAHILTHPEMVEMETALAETLLVPEQVVESSADPSVWLYYRRYQDTQVGEKQLCVVVKTAVDDPFVITAYLTDRVKRGRVLWTRSG